MVFNPFINNDAFSLVSLTKSINILPNMYGRTNEMNLFPGNGVTSRIILAEERNGVISLLPTRPVGAPGTQAKQGKRKARTFSVPHIPLSDVILPDEYDGVRAFGTEDQTSPVELIMLDHLQTASNNFAITLEHLRMGALKGIVLDADGSVLYNFYDEFNITQKIINFSLGTATTNVRNKCMDVSRHMEDNATGEVYSRIHVLCSPDFFDAFIGHAKVEEVWKNWQGAAERLGGDPRKGFDFGGLMFEEYRGKATTADGTVRKFIADGEAHAFPMGTMNSFETLFAPADFLETVNTRGLEKYAKMKIRDFERGVDLHFQMNPLPICYRPALLVKLKKS